MADNEAEAIALASFAVAFATLRRLEVKGLLFPDETNEIYDESLRILEVLSETENQSETLDGAREFLEVGCLALRGSSRPARPQGRG